MRNRDSVIARYSEGAAGARAAAESGAAVVVVDAFRASTTIAVLVFIGARVLATASVEEAESVSADMRIGERGSARLSGFDFGNSPMELQRANIPPGSRISLTTTNGTRVLEAAAGAPQVYTGAFVNAGAVAEALAFAEHPEVSVVGCGWEGSSSSEDEAAAGAILRHLEKQGFRLDHRARGAVRSYESSTKEALKNNSAARRLKRLNYAEDLDFCLAEDSVPVVPQLVNGVFCEWRK